MSLAINEHLHTLFIRVDERLVDRMKHAPRTHTKKNHLNAECGVIFDIWRGNGAHMQMGRTHVMRVRIDVCGPKCMWKRGGEGETQAK